MNKTNMISTMSYKQLLNRIKTVKQKIIIIINNKIILNL